MAALRNRGGGKELKNVLNKYRVALGYVFEDDQSPF
jgi:hypothetical protein